MRALFLSEGHESASMDRLSPGKYVTRGIGATEPIDPMMVRMKMQISSGTPTDIIGPAPRIHGLVGRSSSATVQGPGGEIGSSSSLDLVQCFARSATVVPVISRNVS